MSEAVYRRGLAGGFSPICRRRKGCQKTVLEAMNYSMKAGGKRLRPLFLRETYRMLGGTGRAADPFMAAI